MPEVKDSGVPGTIFEAVVTDIHEERRVGGKHRWRMSLDRTKFSLERNAGLLEVTARSGAKLEIPVLDVVEEHGEIWHVVEKPLGVGTRVLGRVS